MYLIGIAGRAYINKDNQKIIQTHETVRKAFSKYKDVALVTILPTEDEFYIDKKVGEDKVNKKKLDFVLDKCDAFIVPGGTYYYKFDEYIINYAIKNDKPLLSICLGFQLLCSMHALDRISFNMETKLPTNNHYGKCDEYQHTVKVQDNTMLKRILNKEEIKVDSVHHYIVDFKMKKLIINAISNDGIIEGVEYPNKRFIMGLQWHPEYIIDENTNKILKAFINSIGEENDKI